VPVLVRGVCEVVYLRSPMSSESYHEPIELLSEATKNMHRAIVSLKEELEAVDWYQQRAEACSDDELRGVLVHNKNEEIEHAMMNLEWIRRHSEVFDENIKTYIGAKGPILAVEKAQAASESGGGAGKPSSISATLGIGSLKGGK
jgi:ferritin-like protein